MSLETQMEPPTRTLGAYELLEKIAEGGMGTVYKARQRFSGQIVAIKIVANHLTANRVLLRRFAQEYNAARQLDHPNIVRALDYGHDGPSPYLVMEFVEGESLGRRLSREGKLAEAEAVRIIAQAARALHRAHRRGLVHRDVKPDNILLTHDGQVKVADLGLVKEIDAESNLTRTGRGLGTPHFMAPEQFRNAKNADARCDIYSLAATLYMMVTGELPFEGCNPLDAWMKKLKHELKPPRELRADLSARTDWAIRRAMDAEPGKRPVSCRQFIEELTGRSTRKLSLPADGDMWYLVYSGEDEVKRKARGTSAAVRRSLQSGALGAAARVRVGRSKSGPFVPLRKVAEFRDLAPEPAPAHTGINAATPVPEPRRARPKGKPAPRSLAHAALSREPDADSGAAPLIDFGQTRPERSSILVILLLLTIIAGAGAYAAWHLLNAFRLL